MVTKKLLEYRNKTHCIYFLAMNDFYNTLILATENSNMLVTHSSKIVLIIEHLDINEEARC